MKILVSILFVLLQILSCQKSSLKSINSSHDEKLLYYSDFKKSNDSSKENFRIYDAFLFKDKPSLYKDGLSKINMIYDDSIMAYPNKDNLNYAIISQNKYSKALRNINPSFPICLDVETWDFSKENISKSVIKYKKLLQGIKQEFPKTPIGYYGVIPYADLNLYVDQYNLYNAKNNKKWKDDWVRINSNLGPIISNSNIAFPSCYTRTNDRNMWKDIFLQQIRKIRQTSPDIKIYPFIWPQYYSPGVGYNFHYIDSDFWYFQLQTIYEYCDGVVLWAPHINPANREDNKWNESKEWWQTTKKFIKNKNIKTNNNEDQ